MTHETALPGGATGTVAGRVSHFVAVTEPPSSTAAGSVALPAGLTERSGAAPTVSGSENGRKQTMTSVPRRKGVPTGPGTGHLERGLRAAAPGGPIRGTTRRTATGERG